MSRRSFRALAVLLLGLVSVIPVAGLNPPVLAATEFAPTRFDDPVPDGCQPGDCSLREAVIAANQASGADSISLGAGTYTLSIAGTGEGEAATGDLDINDSVTIIGAGADVTIVDGGGVDRVFEVTSADFTLSDVTVQNGEVDDYGAGIMNPGGSNLTVERVTISNNLSIGHLAEQIFHGGGGIFNQGTLTLSESTISANEARESGGGGLYNGGEATITNSTISGNSTTGGDFGGAGVYQTSGTLLLVNSTISNNTGGGTFGAGIRTLSGGSAVNTIVAGNVPDDCGGNTGAMTSLGHNLGGDASCEFDAAGDLLETDPLLGALADNGGPTQTHALLEGSPAINAGDGDACPATDQRGFARTGVCDVGSYEFDGIPLELKQGDVNCDNSVNSVDALIILRVKAGLPTTAACVDLAGDVNCDGSLTAVDALGILRFAAGLPVSQNNPCPDVGTPV
ncbi:MAG TPA: choice-of-anchor Q domain-containing protein [Dehalococcoidia bacterium]|nr:choice-of-anchor Q domain-containing protein [Dehalococcoidia bacterium]